MADTVAESLYRRDTSPGTPTLGLQSGTIASATTIAPTHFITSVTGTVEVVLVTLPYAGFAGTIALLPIDNPCFTGATGGTATATAKPVGLAFTAVQLKVLYLTYVPSTGLWYPSY